MRSLPVILLKSALAGLFANRWRFNKDALAIRRDPDVINASGTLKVILSYDPINDFIYSGTRMGYNYEPAEYFAGELGTPPEVVVVRDMNRLLGAPCIPGKKAAPPWLLRQLRIAVPGAESLPKYPLCYSEGRFT